MRLIDADRLLNPGYTDMWDEPIKFDMISRYAIESEPTVKAIPMDWISAYTRTAITNADYWAIIRMVTKWEKENEAD